MIIYNVTLVVEDDIRDEWLKWMQEIHIPEVMATGKFSGYRLLSILDSPNEGQSYCAQYYTSSVEQYNAYVEEDAARLQGALAEKFGHQYVAFRTLMEVLDEQN
ncbi:MAG: DUF4286 family protein [Mucilaginibacter polytrichastri]|nr:DUF4286 family protein [Mucilaginibacter polytrichastri]